MRNLVLTLTSLFIGLLFVGCVPTLNSSSKEDCEKKSGYSWDAGKKRCVSDAVTVTDDDDDDDSITTTSGGSGNRSGSSNRRSGSSSNKVSYGETQVASDYACTLISSDLYCQSGKDDFERVEQDVKEFKLVSFSDMNLSPSSGSAYQYALLMILRDDGEFFIEKSGNFTTDTHKILTFGRAIQDVENFSIHGATVCVQLEGDIDEDEEGAIRCWGDNKVGQVGIPFESDKDTVEYSDVEDSSVLSHLDIDGRTTFQSFKMFGIKDSTNGGYKTGICGLNLDNHLYCWGHVSGAGTIGVGDAGKPYSPRGNSKYPIYKVQLKNGESVVDQDEVSFEVSEDDDYRISEKGHVMYAYGEKDGEDAEWYAFGHIGGTAYNPNDDTTKKGFGTLKIQEEPIRMVASDKTEDSSSVFDVIVTNGNQQCVVTNDDNLRCVFFNGVVDSEFQGEERVTDSDTDTTVGNSWFTAYGDSDDDDDDNTVADSEEDVYIVGTDKGHLCWVYGDDRKLACSFGLKSENVEDVDYLKTHENAFCALHDSTKLYCHAGVSSTGSSNAEAELDDDDAEVDNFYIGGASGSEFVLALTDKSRAYGWSQNKISNEALNTDNKHAIAEGFGDDIDNQEDEDESDSGDDLDNLSCLELDEIYTGSHTYVVGISGSDYFSWGSSTSHENTGIYGNKKGCDEDEIDDAKVDFDPPR